jgi:hypothetical protein
MVIVSIGYELQAWVRADNSCATKRMVGRDSGLSFTHCKAIVTTNATSNAIWPMGCGSLWSNTSFRRNSAVSETGIVVVDLDDDKEDRSSLGCLPIITSNATTPKL